MHIFDQGYAGFPWLFILLESQVRWLLRWRPDYHLCDCAGHKKTPGKLTGHLRCWQQAPGWDAVHQRPIQLKGLALPVHHPEPVLASQILWLVVCRRDHNLPPWYRLTAEPITDADDLWTLVFAYSRRWQIEQMWRACKNERSFESPRLHEWEHRRRLLLLASLAYAFLLELMQPPWQGTRDWVMHFWCRRTGAQAPSDPRAFHTLTHRPQSALACLSPFHPAPRPRFPWRCLPSLPRFGMNHVCMTASVKTNFPLHW